MQPAMFLVCFFAIFACALASNRNYEFGYGVEDLNTGDIKSHHETKVGDQVSGIYTLKEADGTTRIVKYNAGPHTGFNAVVEKEGVAVHPSQLQVPTNFQSQPIVVADYQAQELPQVQAWPENQAQGWEQQGQWVYAQAGKW